MHTQPRYKKIICTFFAPNANGVLVSNHKESKLIPFNDAIGDGKPAALVERLIKDNPDLKSVFKEGDNGIKVNTLFVTSDFLLPTPDGKFVSNSSDVEVPTTMTLISKERSKDETPVEYRGTKIHPFNKAPTNENRPSDERGLDQQTKPTTAKAGDSTESAESATASTAPVVATASANKTITQPAKPAEGKANSGTVPKGNK